MEELKKKAEKAREFLFEVKKLYALALSEMKKEQSPWLRSLYENVILPEIVPILKTDDLFSLYFGRKKSILRMSSWLAESVPMIGRSAFGKALGEVFLKYEEIV